MTAEDVEAAGPLNEDFELLTLEDFEGCSPTTGGVWAHYSMTVAHCL